MSASMAEVLTAHQGTSKLLSPSDVRMACLCGRFAQDDEIPTYGNAWIIAHQAEVLAANGYGKLEPTKFVLAEREAELLNLKGPCRAPQCRLHHAHRGPCNTRRPE